MLHILNTDTKRQGEVPVANTSRRRVGFVAEISSALTGP